MSPIKRIGQRLSQSNNTYIKDDDLPPLLAPSQSTLIMDNDGISGDFEDVDLEPLSLPRSEGRQELTTPRQPQSNPRGVRCKPENYFIQSAAQIQRPEPAHYRRQRSQINPESHIERDFMSLAEALRDESLNLGTPIAPRPPTWVERIRKAWRYVRGEVNMEIDLEANRHPLGMSTNTKRDSRDPLRANLWRLRKRSRKLLRQLFGKEGRMVKTERPQMGSRDIASILPMPGRTYAASTRVQSVRPKAVVEKHDKVNGFMNPKAEEAWNILNVEPRRSISAAKSTRHGRTHVPNGSIELVDFQPLTDVSEAAYQKWLASSESTAIVFDIGGAHITPWPPQPTRAAPSPPIQSHDSGEYNDDLGSTADVSDDGSLDVGPQLYDGQNDDSVSNETGRRRRDSVSLIYPNSQLRSSVDIARTLEASEAKFSTPKRAKTDPSPRNTSAKRPEGENTPRYLGFLDKLFYSRLVNSHRVRRSISAPTPPTPFEDPSPGRKNNWEGTEDYLTGRSPTPSPDMTEEEFMAAYFLRTSDEDDDHTSVDSNNPGPDNQTSGLNIQGVDSLMDGHSNERLHQPPHVVKRDATKDGPRPQLRRKKAFNKAELKRNPSDNSLPEEYGFGTEGEKHLPEYIRDLRRRALDEPTTGAEAAQRQLLKQDPQLHKDFAHFTKLRQEKLSPKIDRSPALEPLRYEPGHLHRSPLTPGGFAETKSAPETYSPFPSLKLCEMTQSEPDGTQQSKATKTRRRANATCKQNPSVTRFPVKPSRQNSQSASPTSETVRQQAYSTPEPAKQSSISASTPQTPSVVKFRRPKVDTPFEFPAKSPKILEDLSECSSTAELKSNDPIESLPPFKENAGNDQSPPAIQQPLQPALPQLPFSQAVVSQPVAQRPRADSNGLRELILKPQGLRQDSKALTQAETANELLPAAPNQDVPRKIVRLSRADSQGLRSFRLPISASPQGSGCALPTFAVGTELKLPVTAPQEPISESTVQRSRLGSLNLRSPKVQASEQASMPAPAPGIPRISHSHSPSKRKVEDGVVEGGVDGTGDMEKSCNGYEEDESVDGRVGVAKKVKVQSALMPEEAMLPAPNRRRVPRPAQGPATASATGSPCAHASKTLYLANDPAYRGRHKPAANVSLLNPHHPQPRPFQVPRLQSGQQPPEPLFIITPPTTDDPAVPVKTVSFADMMDDRLQPRADPSPIKTKAVEDARQMQAAVIDMCNRTGKSPPRYVLTELIGKGTFGRVYKSKNLSSAEIVAVKIIDIDESDTMNPRLADAYSDFMKEVQALQKLNETKARNINHIIEALPVGSAMWMITEHCGGGSVSTLMKPTAPGGLQEKWIIPILREVAEAIMWVHQADIIHRDIKCANVLITEEGGVQLCDFGVAGIIEDKLDKRSTVIGTPHWMAPEMFSSTPSYGKEIDIWAFGSMVYEIATGLPPNVGYANSFEDLQARHRTATPRLEGGNYSKDLRDLVAFCLEELPSARPSIEQVQRHPYIFNTSSRYPTSSLSHLVRAFKVWEQHGGSRKSLFMAGGAQAPSDPASGSANDDEWNFSTTQAFDDDLANNASAQDVLDAYGSAIMLSEEPPRAKGGRRRPPPQALAAPLNPLLKVFDPNTKSNYHDNSRVHYGLQMPPPTSDLPLRDDSARTAIKDTMIDLDGHDSDPGFSSFREDTIKPAGRRMEDEDEFSTMHDFSRPALSDPADANPNRRTQDWTFPSASKMAPPASADPELSRFPSSYGVPRPAVTPGSGGRPALMHHPTEPLGVPLAGGMMGASQFAPERRSMAESLIDLDMSMPDTYPELTRPSTANSDVGSTTSEQMTSGNPFEFERHVSYQPPVEQAEPSIYIDDTALTARPDSQNQNRDIADVSDFSVSDVEPEHRDDPNDLSRFDVSGFSDGEYVSMAPTTGLDDSKISVHPKPYTVAHFPELPEPPSAAALMGTASPAEMASEFQRTLDSLIGQLGAFADVYISEEVVPKRNSKRK